jgi:hypothetical protein
MEQRRINEKASAFVNMRRRDAGAPRAERVDTAKTIAIFFKLAHAWKGDILDSPLCC